VLTLRNLHILAARWRSPSLPLGDPGNLDGTIPYSVSTLVSRDKMARYGATNSQRTGFSE